MTLTTRDLTCGYHNRTVLTGLNLNFTEGAVTALLGPNGSGKSTLLKTLCRTLKPVAGDVQLLSPSPFSGRGVRGEGPEASLAALSPKDLAKIIAVVPQEEHFAFHFTVRQIVIMGRLPHSDGLLDTPEDHEVADEAMRQADCYEFRDRHVTELSGGERQRVLIARALAQRAPILLLDEPTTHLDIAHQGALATLLRKFAGDGGTVIAAIHDLNLASQLASRAVLLNEGTMVLAAGIEETLNSRMLDEVYQVAFSRLQTPNGRTLVVQA